MQVKHGCCLDQKWLHWRIVLVVDRPGSVSGGSIFHHTQVFVYADTKEQIKSSQANVG
jgi:hypothetical protein